MEKRAIYRLSAALAALLLLVRCGGGTDGTGGTTPLPPTAQSVVIGVMTKGSVIVNGIRFDDSSATVRIDDRSGTSAELATGMFVKVLGRINADNATGTADRVEAENEVRGTVQAVNAGGNPPSFTVAGLTIYVDSTTVFANLSGIGALVAGTTRVEVHGLRDADGNVRASRVEGKDATFDDELKGKVSNLNTAAQTFTLGAVTVSYAGATLSPSGATLADGVAVQVHGSLNATTGVFTATKVDREDLEDAVFQPSNGGKLELEGFVTGLTATGTFQIGTRTVQTTATTRFEGGSSTDLANGVKVEAEGTLDANGTLVASKIEFKSGSGGSGPSGIVKLTGIASAVDVSARTVTMFGKTVQINDLTELKDNLQLQNVVAGTARLDVRASLDAGGNVIAQRVEITNDTRDTVQARVTAKNDSSFTLTLLDTITAALGGSGVEFRDTGGATISRDQFFAAITPRSATAAGTLVKVRGTFSGSTLTADRAELEN
jgi:hypothetical protein